MLFLASAGPRRLPTGIWSAHVRGRVRHTEVIELNPVKYPDSRAGYRIVDSVSLRGLPAGPRKVARRPNECPEAGSPAGIRIVGRCGVSIASARFRGLQRGDVGNSESPHLGGLS